MIQKPYTVAEISRDITGASGNILSADVHTVVGSKKRKRTELALAIDHEGVNIYDVQSSKIITSYAVSPQAVFTCPPCSIRRRRQGTKAARRSTYCSTISPLPRLLCYAECSASGYGQKDQISTTSINLDKKSSPVLHLDTFCVGSEHGSTSENRVLAVHEDGMIACYSENLESLEWTAGLKDGFKVQESPRSTRVVLATVMGIEQARKTVLKDREDLLARVEKDSDDVGGSLLMLVSRSQQIKATRGHGSLDLRVLALNAPITNNSPRNGRSVQELASVVIPEPNHSRAGSDRFTFQAATGTLYQLGENVMIIYNLAGSVPKMAHDLTLGSTLSSCLQLSRGLLACCSPQSLSIMDSAYYSLQDSFPFSGDSPASVTRKSPEASSDQTTNKADAKLLSYYAPLNTVIALERRKILAIQLSSTTLQDGRLGKRKRQPSLAASLGKGYHLATAKPSTAAVTERNIRSLGSYLPLNTINDCYSQKAEVDRISSHLDTEQPHTASVQTSALKPSATWNSKVDPVVDKDKVYQLFSKMFAVEKTQQTNSSDTDAHRKLKILFVQRETCNSLIEVGLFTAHHVEMAMKHYGPMPCSSNLAPGALIQALAVWDPSLDLLLTMLASPLPLSSRELACTLAILIQSTQNSEATDLTKLLTNGPLDDGSDKAEKLHLTNGEFVQDSLSTSSANDALDHRLLNLTLKRLYAISSSSVARALRTDLSTRQLRVLVDTLRLEIARSGWLSPYDDRLESMDHEIKDDNQICHIAHLLNCAIDTIGTGGWVLGTSISDESTETADTIGYMKAEISAALEGIEEATYLKGMLGEVLLCGKNSLQLSTKSTKPEQGLRASLTIKPFTIALDGHNSGLLPLGLKPAPIISTTKVGAGGELIPRRARDIGRLKSKAVGKYSFDRIII